MAQNSRVSFRASFMLEEVQNNHIVTLLHFLLWLWKPHIDLYEVTDSLLGSLWVLLMPYLEIRIPFYNSSLEKS